jgi:type IV pilus assembly protein PilB
MEKDQYTNKNHQEESQSPKTSPKSKKIEPRLPYKEPIEGFLKEITRKEEEKQIQVKAAKLNLPYINLLSLSISQDVLRIIPEDIACKYKIVPFVKIDNRVRIAALDPKDPKVNKIIETLQQGSGYSFDIALASNSSIEYGLKLYKIFVSSPETQLEEGRLKVAEKTLEEFEQEIKTFSDLKEKITTVPTTKIVDLILGGGVITCASDIHIEPEEKQTRIRYRIDGALQDVASLPRKIFPQIVARVKFLSRLKLDLTRIPQDGRFNIKSKEKRIDIRVATLPTVYGENVELRLFDQEAQFLSLGQLGLEGESLKKVSQNIQKSHGMILVCGPTGSGKTTTLYAILEILNKPEVKIITLEDPIEYHLPKIIQSQVDPEVKYDFANGLKSILRQDPNILMVGEIRDYDTAEMAVHAGLTGHIVLSTLHTNDASGALPRLIDMGIKPYILTNSINAIVAQRLVRRICLKCKRKYKPSKGMLQEIKQIIKTLPASEIKRVKIGKFYKGSGCDFCNQTGYKGRIGLFEVLTLDDKIKNLILDIATVSEIKKAALRSGMTTMEQDGILKVLKGITTPEEVWRVMRE